MEMEDHTHPPHHHNNQYGIDLHHFITGRSTTHFPTAIPPQPPSPDLFARSSHHHHQLPPQAAAAAQHHHHHYDMMMLMPRGGVGLHHHHHEFLSDSSNNSVCVAATAPPPPPANSANNNNNNNNNNTSASTAGGVVAGAAGGPSHSGLLEGEAAGCSFGGDFGTGRWPRQETLTLLEIRSRLDSKFKEANQKGPLWDEVSRIMSEEHGYQRSGKKCREKFENLYKYYKKTKEGKAGRQDGKHYRFFRQLEALCGDTNNNQASCSIPESHFLGHTSNSLGFTNTSTQPNHQEISFHTTTHQKLCDSLSLSNNNSSEFDTCSSEDNDLSTATLENESTDKRRKRRGGKNWKAKIKDFIDSQMRKLMERQEAWLEKLTKTLEQKEQERILREEMWKKQEASRIDREHKFWAEERAWIEARDAALMEALQKLTGREVNAAEIQNPSEDQNNEDGTSETINNNNEKLNKKRKDNSRNSCYFQSNESVYVPGEACCNQDGASPGNSQATGNNNNNVSDSCFRFLMGDGENLWENYGLKINKGDDDDGDDDDDNDQHQN